MNCNTQNAKIASITEKTLIVGIDVGSETHYARAIRTGKLRIYQKHWNSVNKRQVSISKHGWEDYAANT